MQSCKTKTLPVFFDADYLVYQVGFACQTEYWVVTEEDDQGVAVSYGPFAGVKKRNEWVEQSGISGARFYSRIEPEDDAHAFHTMNIQIRAALKRLREKFDCDVEC